MSNYSSVEQFKKITQSFSKIFDIKLNNVRHKVSIEEGYKNTNAFIASLPEVDSLQSVDEGENEIYIKPTLIESVQLRPGLFIKSDSSEVFDIAFDTFIGNFKSNKCNEINVTTNPNGMIEISDNSKNIFESYFSNTNDKSIFNTICDFNYNDEYFNNIIESNMNNISNWYIINAMSETFIVSYKTKDSFYSINFKNGKINQDKITNNDAISLGMSIKFKLDFSRFEENSYDFDKIYLKMQESARSNPGLQLHILNNSNHMTNYLLKYQSTEDMFNSMFKYTSPKHRTTNFSFVDSKTNESVLFSFIKTQSNKPFKCISFINDINTPAGGTHVQGFVAALKDLSDNYSLSKDLRGVEAILIVNSHDFELSVSNSKLISRNIKKDVYSYIIDNI